MQHCRRGGGPLASVALLLAVTDTSTSDDVAAAATARNDSASFRLLQPQSGSQIPSNFECEFVLPVDAARGSLTMNFTWTGGAPDPASPHVVTMAPSLESRGHHGPFQFSALSTAAARMPQVAAVSSHNTGRPAADLVHSSIYRIDLGFQPRNASNQRRYHVVATDVQRTDLLWLLGMGASLLGSCGVASGGVLQKRAHVYDQRKPQCERARTICGGVLVSWQWLLGFLLFAVLPVPFAMISLALAGQSLIMPLTGASVVMNQVFAPCVLGERLTRVDAGATGIVVVGIGVSSAFGVHSDGSYSLAQLVALWSRPAHLITTGVVLVVSCACYLCIAAREYRCRMASASGEAERVRSVGDYLPPLLSRGEPCGGGTPTGDGLLQSMQPVFYAVLCGACGAFTNLFLKGLAELIKDLLAGSLGVFAAPAFYVFVACTVFFAVSQVVWINKGLAEFEAVKFIPAYSAALSLVGSLVGVVYFEEYKQLTTAGAVLWPVGAVISAFGILILLLNNSHSATTSSKASAHAPVARSSSLESAVEYRGA
jgi:hypothetical protein